MGAQFTIPLITVIPGQLIASTLWNNEFNNISTNFIPAGMDSYSDTDSQMQIQTNPYPGSVTSHATSLGGEIERIRYQIAQMLGNTYWYQPPNISLGSVNNVVVPIGGIIEYHSSTPPSASFHVADGSPISRTTYSALFALYNAASLPFGAGDGSTTFNLPNYTDRMSIAAGHLYSVAATGGEATHVLTNAEVPATPISATDAGHTHGITDPSHAHNLHTYTTNGVNGLLPTGQNGSEQGASPSGGAIVANTTGISVNSGQASISGTVSGSGGAHNNLPPYLGMFKLIRVL